MLTSNPIDLCNVNIKQPSIHSMFRGCNVSTGMLSDVKVLFEHAQGVPPNNHNIQLLQGPAEGVWAWPAEGVWAWPAEGVWAWPAEGVWAWPAEGVWAWPQLSQTPTLVFTVSTQLSMPSSYQAHIHYIYTCTFTYTLYNTHTQVGTRVQNN